MLLPAPDGPTKAMVSPGATSRLKLASAALSGPRRIVKRDIVETHGAATRAGSSSGCGGALMDGPRLQQLAQALHGARGALHLAPHFGERGGGAADEAGVQQELKELPAGHRAGEHLAHAQPQDEGDAGKHQRDADRR